MRRDRPVEEGGQAETGGGGEGIEDQEQDAADRFFREGDEPDWTAWRTDPRGPVDRPAQGTGERPSTPTPRTGPEEEARPRDRDRFWDDDPAESAETPRSPHAPPTPRPRPAPPPASPASPPPTSQPPAPSTGASQSRAEAAPQPPPPEETRPWSYPGEVASPAAPATPARPGPGVARRVVRTVRRFDPWSVLKFSVLFYFSVALVFVFAAMMLFFAAEAAGIIDKLEAFVQGIGWPDWRIRPIQLFRALILLGVINVIVWSAVTLFVTVLYNLVADVVGGVRVTMSEREI